MYGLEKSEQNPIFFVNLYFIFVGVKQPAPGDQYSIGAKIL